MKRLFLGIDTSCYTTSVACVDEDGIVFDQRTMLSVASGERGLRQSDGVFLHVRNLPPLITSLFATIDSDAVEQVFVSAKPTDAADSYMPVFLAGRLAAVSLAETLHVPLLEGSHQAGHVRAALFGNAPLRENNRLFAFHLSGGTTDVLDVHLQDGQIESISRIGGSEDLHAGQFVDRIGVRLGLPFPCGKALEALAERASHRSIRIPSTVRGVSCSLSGAESALQRLLSDPAAPAPEDAAYAVFDCLARTIAKLIDALPEDAGANGAPVLLSGGVSSSLLLRNLLKMRTARPFFAARPALSSDNAVGAALLGMDAWRGTHA